MALRSAGRNRGASAFAGEALVSRTASASRPSGVDLSRKSSSGPRQGANNKPDLYAAAAVCTKVRSCLVSSISEGL